VLIDDARNPKGPPTGPKSLYADQTWVGSTMGGLPPAQWPAWTQITVQDYSDVSRSAADGGTRARHDPTTNGASPIRLTHRQPIST